IGTGRPVDARADQFSFCVALDKALGGQERSAPVWLRQIAQRGRRADAEQRFPDMQAVRQALADDPVSRRRRWVVRLVLGTVALAALVWTVVERREARDPTACTAAAAARLSSVWDDERKAKLRAAIAPADVGAFERIAHDLDQYAG